LQGEADKVNEVIKWCHTGPAAAKVERVDVAYESGQERFTHFFIR
jgi:acylphosphatase